MICASGVTIAGTGAVYNSKLRKEKETCNRVVSAVLLVGDFCRNKKWKVEDWEIGSRVLGTLATVRVTSEYQWITDF